MSGMTLNISSTIHALEWTLGPLLHLVQQVIQVALCFFLPRRQTNNSAESVFEGSPIVHDFVSNRNILLYPSGSVLSHSLNLK